MSHRSHRNHSSRLCAVLVDCPDETFESSVDFWSGALARPPKPRTEPDARYAYLETPSELPIDLMLQRVPSSESALHLDIETDDVDAEVARLVGLGARKKAKVKEWWVLEDPSGHPFCVVPAESGSWPRGAVEWSDKPS